MKAFITPIDREDLALNSQNMDDLTDKIEDVLIRIYYNHISYIREDAFQMVDVFIRCCEEICLLMEELRHFKHSQKLHKCIVRINCLEKESDGLFISCTYSLHGISVNPLHILVCREIYLYLEKYVDTCEHIADIVESVVMKNC